MAIVMIAIILDGEKRTQLYQSDFVLTSLKSTEQI